MSTTPAMRRQAHWKTGLCRSVPAVRPCVVATTKTTKLVRCTACQVRRGILRIASDVISIARSRYMRDHAERHSRGLVARDERHKEVCRPEADEVVKAETKEVHTDERHRKAAKESVYVEHPTGCGLANQPGRELQTADDRKRRERPGDDPSGPRRVPPCLRTHAWSLLGRGSAAARRGVRRSAGVCRRARRVPVAGVAPTSTSRWARSRSRWLRPAPRRSSRSRSPRSRRSRRTRQRSARRAAIGWLPPGDAAGSVPSTARTRLAAPHVGRRGALRRGRDRRATRSRTARLESPDPLGLIEVVDVVSHQIRVLLLGRCASPLPYRLRAPARRSRVIRCGSSLLSPNSVETIAAFGRTGVAGDDDANPSAPRFAPMAIVAATRLIEIALAAATAVFLCITRTSAFFRPEPLGCTNFVASGNTRIVKVRARSP